MSCAVPNCKNTCRKNKNVRFHTFPSEDKPIFHKWLNAIGISHTTFKEKRSVRQYVCSTHFSAGAYKEPLSRNGRFHFLKAHAIPTLRVSSQQSQTDNPTLKLSVPRNNSKSSSTAEEASIKPAEVQCQEYNYTSLTTTTSTSREAENSPDLQSASNTTANHPKSSSCDVETQTTISCFAYKDVDWIAKLSSTLPSPMFQARTEAVTDRFSYEQIRRRFWLDHNYSGAFDSKVENNPSTVASPPQFISESPLDDTYSNDDTSSTISSMMDTEDVGRGEPDHIYEDFMQTAWSFSDSDSSATMDSEPPITPAKDTKYIVFESCLRELLTRCMKCGNPICEKKLTCHDTSVTVSMICKSSHITKWDSQAPMNRCHAAEVCELSPSTKTEPSSGLESAFTVGKSSAESASSQTEQYDNSVLIKVEPGTDIDQHEPGSISAESIKAETEFDNKIPSPGSHLEQEFKDQSFCPNKQNFVSTVQLNECSGEFEVFIETEPESDTDDAASPVEQLSRDTFPVVSETESESDTDNVASAEQLSRDAFQVFTKMEPMSDDDDNHSEERLRDCSLGIQAQQDGPDQCDQHRVTVKIEPDDEASIDERLEENVLSEEEDESCGRNKPTVVSTEKAAEIRMFCKVEYDPSHGT